MVARIDARARARRQGAGARTTARWSPRPPSLPIVSRRQSRDDEYFEKNDEDTACLDRPLPRRAPVLSHGRGLGRMQPSHGDPARHLIARSTGDHRPFTIHPAAHNDRAIRCYENAASSARRPVQLLSALDVLARPGSARRAHGLLLDLLSRTSSPTPPTTPSNSLLLGSFEQLEQRVRGSCLHRDVEQDLTGCRSETATPMLVDEDANLLVARAREVQDGLPERQPDGTPRRLERTRRRAARPLPAASDRSEGRLRPLSTVAAKPSQHAQRTVPIPAK